MTKTVATTVLVVSVNEVTDDEIDMLKDSHQADSLDKIADEMTEPVKNILRRNVFDDADKIPILDVSADVHDELDYDNVMTVDEVLDR